ncbi:MAG: hypothetical protein ABH847_04445 [Candidatus Omnitrophota bacterium]
MNGSSELTLVEILSAWLAPIIALVGLFYGGIQCYINRKRLKNDYFNRRVEIYESITKHIATMLIEGDPPQGSEIQFLRATKNSYFIFGEDIKEFNNQIYKKTITLQNLCSMSKTLINEGLKNNLDQQQEIKNWFKKELNSIEKKFKKYLKL